MSTKASNGVSGRFTPVRDAPCTEGWSPKISSGYIYTKNHRHKNIKSRALKGREGKRGRKEDWAITQIQSEPKTIRKTARIPVIPLARLADSRRSVSDTRATLIRLITVIMLQSNERNQGRLLQGMNMAFVTWVAMVGFSLNLRIEYSYHFSP